MAPSKYKRQFSTYKYFKYELSSRFFTQHEVPDEHDEPQVVWYIVDNIDDVISSLHKQLHDDCDSKDEFNHFFTKVLAEKNQLKSRHIQWLNETSPKGLNFLMLASNYGNIEVVKFLIKCGLNVNKEDVNGMTASDYAWQKKNAKCLIKLLSADAPFPRHFEVESLEPSEEKLKIIDMVLKMQSFHENIEDGDMTEVQIFVTENPNIRFAYNKDNQCALRTALEVKRTKIYSFLRNKFYAAGVDSENHKILLENLPDKVKKQLREQLRRNLDKPVEDHITALLTKSRDRSGSKDNFKKLFDFYEILNSIPQVSPILKLVAKSDSTDIVFDFNDESVFGMDSTADENVVGLTYDSVGYILIGAGREEAEVLGTIAHELTHWAIQLVYKNKCQPFLDGNNDDRRENYRNIVERYENHENRVVFCTEIEEVYDSAVYPKNDINKELIVRVPHLLALNRGNYDRLDELRETYEDLFKYFEKMVLPDVEKEMLLMDRREEIRKMNRMFGLLEKLLRLNTLSSECKKDITFDKCMLLKTTTFELLFESIVKSLISRGIEIEAEYVFVEVEQLFELKNLEHLIEISKTGAEPKIFILDSKNLRTDQSAHKTMLQNLRKIEAIFISSPKNACLQEIFGPGIDETFKWDDLSDAAKEKVRNSQIFFQDIEVRLGDIIEHEELIEELPLEQLLIPSSIKLISSDNTLPEMPAVFIERKFTLQNDEESGESDDDEESEKDCREPKKGFDNDSEELKKGSDDDGEETKTGSDDDSEEPKKSSDNDSEESTTGSCKYIGDTDGNIGKIENSGEIIENCDGNILKLIWTLFKFMFCNCHGSNGEESFIQDNNGNGEKSADNIEHIQISYENLKNIPEINECIEHFDDAIENNPDTDKNFEDVSFNNVQDNAKSIEEFLEKIGNLSDFVLKSKTVLIADYAGMGKSTSAVKLARDFKFANPCSWVVYIDLKQHTKVFLHDHQPQPEKVDPSFFTFKFLKLKNSCETKLFESFYASGKIFFIIDGFDEISPKYKTFVLKILKTIKNSKNHLLVTTRPHFTRKLEKVLEKKAIHLIPFSKDDQVEFFTKYWRPELNDTDLKPKVEELLIKFEKIWNSNDFCKTPIHIRMLAEVFDNEGLLKINEKTFNIFSFYEKFFDLKLQIWIKKGPLAVDDSVALQQTDPATNFKQIFRRLAIEQVFSPEKAEKLKVPKIPDSIIDEMIARVGIVAYGLNGSAQFTHRTYAEFFVTDLIANNVFRKDPKYEFVELFVKVILKAEDYEKIWNFLNHKLDCINVFETETLAKFFEEIASKDTDWLKLGDSELRSASGNLPSCLQLFDFIINNLNSDQTLKAMFLMFLWRNFGEKLEYFKKIWQSAEETPEAKGFLMKLLLTEVRGKNILSQAITHENHIKAAGPERVSQLVIQYTENILDAEDYLRFYFDEHNKSNLYRKMIFSNEALFEKVWKIAQKKQSSINMEKLKLRKNEDGDTILHFLAYKSAMLMKWLEIIKDLFKPDKFNEYLIRTGSEGDTFISHVLYNRKLKLEEIKKLWEFIEQNSSNYTQWVLLLYKDTRKRMIALECSINIEDKTVVDFVFDISDSFEARTGEDLINLLRSNGTLLEFILNMVTYSNEYFEKYSGKLDGREFRKILSSSVSFYGNVLHYFVRKKNTIVLWNQIVDGIFDQNVVKRLLFEKWCKHWNVFHFAAWNNNHFLIELLEWCKLNFDLTFIKKIFTTRNDQRTLLHELAENGDKILILKCLKFVSINCERDVQQKMLKQKNKDGYLPIEMSFGNRNLGVVSEIAKFYDELFELDELVLMISEMKFSKQLYGIKNNHDFCEMKAVLKIYWRIKNRLENRAKNGKKSKH